MLFIKASKATVCFPVYYLKPWVKDILFEFPIENIHEE